MSFRKRFSTLILAGLGLVGCLDTTPTSAPEPDSNTLPVAAATTTPPASYSLAQWQTGIKDQGGRGTCYAFAAAAALEAFYNREHGLSLDLSEQYIFSMRRVMYVRGDYATGESNGRDHYSSFSDNGGNESIVQYLARFRAPLEQFAPYVEDVEALRDLILPGQNLNTQENVDLYEYDERNIPLEARRKARYGVTSFKYINDQSDPTADLEEAISNDHEVVGSFKLEWTRDPATGVMGYRANANASLHIMLIIGYDRTNGIFTLKNSGGGTAFTRVTYDFVKKCYRGGAYITGVTAPGSPYDVHAKWIGTWNMNSNGHSGKLVIRRFIHLGGKYASFEPTKLGSYYEDGERYEVNGYFEENGRKMIFHVADQPGIVAPGTLTGRKFEAYIHSLDPNSASGRQFPLPGGKFQGLLLSRNDIAAPNTTAPAPERFKGSWAWNYDGVRGTVAITQIIGESTVLGTYTNSSGIVRSLIGTYDPNFNNTIDINIDFGPGVSYKRFIMYHHPGGKRILSGITLEGATSFGAQAYGK